jgi:hypothetical protein
MRRFTYFAFATFVFGIAAVSLLAAADTSFSGTWKLNLGKSQLSGTTYTFSKNASGTMHFDSAGFAFDFDLTGKEYPGPDGGTVSVTAPNPTTWEFTVHENGKVIEKIRDTVNGDTLSAVTTLVKSDGTSIEQTSTDSRVSGGPGILGKWKSGDPKGSATTLQITLDGASGITFNYPDFQQSCKGSFDGKDYVVNEAGKASKLTSAFEKTGSNTFKVTTKLNGKPYYVEVFTLSADGKTLTDEGSAVATNEKTKSVYERQ